MCKNMDSSILAANQVVARTFRWLFLCFMWGITMIVVYYNDHRSTTNCGDDVSNHRSMTIPTMKNLRGKDVASSASMIFVNCLALWMK